MGAVGAMVPAYFSMTVPIGTRNLHSSPHFTFRMPQFRILPTNNKLHNDKRMQPVSIASSRGTHCIMQFCHCKLMSFMDDTRNSCIAKIELVT